MVFHFVDMSAAFSIPGAETHDLPCATCASHYIKGKKVSKEKFMLLSFVNDIHMCTCAEIQNVNSYVYKTCFPQTSTLCIYPAILLFIFPNTII